MEHSAHVGRNSGSIREWKANRPTLSFWRVFAVARQGCDSSTYTNTDFPRGGAGEYFNQDLIGSRLHCMLARHCLHDPITVWKSRSDRSACILVWLLSVFGASCHQYSTFQVQGHQLLAKLLPGIRTTMQVHTLSVPCVLSFLFAIVTPLDMHPFSSPYMARVVATDSGR